SHSVHNASDMRRRLHCGLAATSSRIRPTSGSSKRRPCTTTASLMAGSMAKAIDGVQRKMQSGPIPEPARPAFDAVQQQLALFRVADLVELARLVDRLGRRDSMKARDGV